MKCAWVLLASIGLAGCASAPPPSVASSGWDEIDNARVAAVERAARVAGVQVVWVHAPRKAVAAGS
jgi:starvation-inducible outer membrane lipoprotein